MLLGGALYAQNATPSPTPAPPAPTLEQRVAGLEAYLTNGDPTGPLTRWRTTWGAVAQARI